MQEGDSSVQVKSTGTGRVISVTRDAITGMTVAIQHAGGYESLYGHLEEPFVEKGDWVESGDVIGVLPSKSSPPYTTLYFALKNNDRYIDPAELISFD
ncbi:Stage IV sporulation protein FA [compost metagenome]